MRLRVRSLFASADRSRFASASHALSLSAIVALVVWVVALVLPTNEVTLFHGLPLDSGPQLLLGAIALLVVTNSTARGIARRLCASAGPVGWWVALVLGLAVIVAKVLLLVGTDPVGFRGCYTSDFPEARGGVGIFAPQQGCGRSYENLFNRQGTTRFDEAIDFGPSKDEAAGIQDTNWNLSFLNTIRFNKYLPGQTDRSRPPLRVRWSGEVDITRERLAVKYVGQGRLEIGGRSTRLEPSYTKSNRVLVQVQRGRQEFRLDFVFDDGSKIGSGPPAGPFAQIRVTELGGPGEHELLRPVGPSSAARALGAFSDVSLAAFALVLLATLVIALARVGRVLALLGVLAGVAWLLHRGGVGLAPSVLPVSTEVLALLVAFVLLLYLAPDRLASLGIPCALLATGYLVLSGTSGVQAVLYRPGGSDWLTYQGFAHTILDTGSLQGGEDVFFYQPGFRYLVFAGHVLVGDGDRIPAVLGLLGLTGAVFVLARWLMTPATARQTRMIIGVVGVALLALVTSRPVADLVRVGANEYPTWILLLLALPLLFVRDSTWWALGGSAALGLCVVTRPNQTIGALFLFAIFAAVNARRVPRRVIACVLLFGAILLLPAVHNAYYGGELAFSSTNAGTAYDLPVRDLPQVFTDGATRQLLREKIAGMLYLSDRFPRDAMLGLSILTLQASWIIIVARMILRRRTVPWFGWCIALWPFAFALPHIFYDISNLYPRHIIAPYVAMGATTVFIESQLLANPRVEHDDSRPADVDVVDDGTGPSFSDDRRVPMNERTS